MNNNYYLSFLVKNTYDGNDAALARKLHENENGRARRQAAKKPVVG